MSQKHTQKHTASARLIVGVATLLGAFSTFQAYNFVRLFSEHKQPLFGLALVNFSFWYGWALLAPIVLWVARRFPLERGIWKRSVPVHLLTVFVLIFVHVMLTEWVFVSVPGSGWQRKLTWWDRVTRDFIMNFDWEMMTYGAIIGFSHAANYFRQAQDRALRTSQLETRLAEAQLQALQRQLHPHFLFNTLNGISALMHRDVQAADRMLVRLSDLLRMALDRRSAQEVPLTNDLEFLGKDKDQDGDIDTVETDTDGDGVSDTVDHQLEQVLSDERYLRLQVELTVASNELDDASEENLAKLRDQAEELIGLRSADLDAMVAQL